MVRSRFVRIATAVFALSALIVAAASAQEQEGTEIPVRTTPRTYETKPARSSDYLAWAQTTRSRPNRPTVVVKPDGASPFKVGTSGMSETMGSLDGNRLVYQQFNNKGSSIRVMNLETRQSRRMRAVNSRRWEFWPRADGPWVMFGRIVSERKQKLMLVNTSTGEQRVLDSAGIRAYILPGQVNGDYAVWNVMGLGNKAKVKRHRISTGNTTTLPTGDRYNWGPSVTERGTTYFGRSTRLCGGNAGLFRASRDGSVTEILSFPQGEDMGSSWVYRNEQGKIQIFHDRASCTDGTVAKTDLFKVIDPSTVTLTTVVESQGNASGTVTGAGIDCGTDCTQDFEPGDQVTLTATPSEGSNFEGWSEASCGTQPTCTATVTQDMTVTATFRP